MMLPSLAVMVVMAPDCSMVTSPATTLAPSTPACAMGTPGGA
jgi:hypothetical protein